MISFFAKEPYILEKPSGSTRQRMSTVIRAEEIAEYIGGKVNPEQTQGTCIYLKPHSLNHIKDGDYVDVLDDLKVTNKMSSRPGINVIAMTTPHKEWLESFLPNKVFHVPHPHVNLERKVRIRKEVTTCGYVGANKPAQRYWAEKLKSRLAKENIEFIPLFNFKTREDIIKFYEGIDIQVIGNFGFLTDVPYYHEKKIVDAMSFGIPTISERKLGYRDVEDYYIKVGSVEELIAQVKSLQEDYIRPQVLINKAEEYHISNIAKLYERLEHTDSR